MVDSTESKLRKMEEEMSRFEAEIASQSSHVQVNHSLSSTLHYTQPSTFAMPYVPGSQFASPGLMPPNHLLSHQTAPGVYMPQTYAMGPTYMSPAAPPPVCQAPQTVISAPPQMAAPSELAAAVRANREAEAAAKLAASEDTFDVDDDVTRALLAAAAGVTYNNQTTQTSSSTSSVTSKAASSNSASTQATNVVPAVPSKTVVVPQSLLPAQLLSSTQRTIPRVPLVPGGSASGSYLDSSTSLPMRSKSSLTEEPYSFQKKVYKRVAAGMVWEDPTLGDWDPNDFRIFCGDLGNEVSDDTLIRAFSRYPSFRKAKVIVDKRTGKSRGYGFVSFSDPNDFTRAIREMNGKYVGNRPIKLKKSDWKNRQLETYRKKEKAKKKLGLKI
uniref:RNA-binding protein 42 n=1 Tax=Mesocestoides corti TaxID=53468 RepID=A0A5K3FJ96_MESCO